jgi:hypothetical protein
MDVGVDEPFKAGRYQRRFDYRLRQQAATKGRQRGSVNGRPVSWGSEGWARLQQDPTIFSYDHRPSLLKTSLPPRRGIEHTPL